MDYKNKVIEKLSEYINLSKEIINNLIEIPPKQELGDYAFPCFVLAKRLKKDPGIIAKELKEQLCDVEGFERIECFGPYINFFVAGSDFVEAVIEKILVEKEDYGRSDEGEGKTVIVEYTSGNMAKHFQVNDLFGILLGNSLCKIFKSQGYNPIGIMPIADWGTQFGELIYAYNQWGNSKALEAETTNELLRIYAKFHEEAEINPGLKERARKHFKLLAEGNNEEVAIWTKFKDLSLKESYKVFDLLKVQFDVFEGESFYLNKVEALVEELEEKGLLRESNGAKVVMLKDENMPPFIIKKLDDGTNCVAKDLAASFYRKKTYDFYKNIYVTGKDESLHLNQVFTTIKKMGYDWGKDCVHTSFGLVKLPDKSLSTRSGKISVLMDLLLEAILKTEDIINDKNPKLQNKGEVAQKIGVGAVVFAYLKKGRERDLIFHWDEILNFQGETGPYVQYTYAKGKSILREVGEGLGKVKYSKLCSIEEFELVKELSNFNTYIKQALELLEPSIIAGYIIGVAKAFNRFSDSVNIVNSKEEITKETRVALVKATLQVIENGLKLIGLETVDEM